MISRKQAVRKNYDEVAVDIRAKYIAKVLDLGDVVIDEIIEFVN